MSQRHITEYVVTFDGEPIDPSSVSTSKLDALDYIAGGVARGNDAARYGISHRAVTIGDWASTTYSAVAMHEVVERGDVPSYLGQDAGHALSQRDAQLIADGWVLLSDEAREQSNVERCVAHGLQQVVAAAADVSKLGPMLRLACGHTVAVDISDYDASPQGVVVQSKLDARRFVL